MKDDELPMLTWDNVLLTNICTRLKTIFGEVSRRSPGKDFEGMRVGCYVQVTRNMSDGFRAPILKIIPLLEPDNLEIINVDMPPGKKTRNECVWEGTLGDAFTERILQLTEKSYSAQTPRARIEAPPPPAGLLATGPVRQPAVIPEASDDQILRFLEAHYGHEL